MIQAQLYRSRLSPDQWTPGKLDILGESFCTLELPWLNNQKNVSCVLAGTCICKRQFSSKNGDIKQAFVLQDTEPRTEIQIHIANYPKDILGCIGLGVYFYKNGRGVGSSKNAIKKFMCMLDGINEFKLEIINPRGM